MYGGEHFSRVRALYEALGRPADGDDAAFCLEVDRRLGMMEEAMARLDGEGLFGSGERRLGIVINAEVMPPDYTNTERALRLNPREALVEWLAEAAEPE